MAKKLPAVKAVPKTRRAKIAAAIRKSVACACDAKNHAEYHELMTSRPGPKPLYAGDCIICEAVGFTRDCGCGNGCPIAGIYDPVGITCNDLKWILIEKKNRPDWPEWRKVRDKVLRIVNRYEKGGSEKGKGSSKTASKKAVK